MTPSAAPETADRKLLLLDDEEAIVVPMAKYFRGRQWRVDAACERVEAEALVSHRHYDLVILDLRLTTYGGAEGLDVLREIRRRDPWANVIVLSAYVSPEMEEEALSCGADAVLRKPQPLAELERLANGLQRRRNA